MAFMYGVIIRLQDASFAGNLISLMQNEYAVVLCSMFPVEPFRRYEALQAGCSGGFVCFTVPSHGEKSKVMRQFALFCAEPKLIPFDQEPFAALTRGLDIDGVAVDDCIVVVVFAALIYIKVESNLPGFRIFFFYDSFKGNFCNLPNLIVPFNFRYVSGRGGVLAVFDSLLCRCAFLANSRQDFISLSHKVIS